MAVMIQMQTVNTNCSHACFPVAIQTISKACPDTQVEVQSCNESCQNVCITRRKEHCLVGPNNSSIDEPIDSPLRDSQVCIQHFVNLLNVFQLFKLHHLQKYTKLLQRIILFWSFQRQTLLLGWNPTFDLSHCSCSFLILQIRPGKLDLQFCISHFLDFACGQPVIIHYLLPAKFYTHCKPTAIRQLKVGVSLLVRR